ncbi:MAG: ATP-binding cassette domain-containing protein, partial [Lachnospiraceae bacterium]|nr:ATP-binding cassette domain-containing protein [Lachnospiraceae bacterium]
IVGESGSGKSMTALAAMGLLSRDARVTGGSIRFEGHDILSMSEEELSRVRGNDISMIFQEPMTSLNPVMKIGAQVGEALKLHTSLGKE